MNEQENFHNITQAVYVGQDVVEFQGNALIKPFIAIKLFGYFSKRAK